jgi:hypothetical protein
MASILAGMHGLRTKGEEKTSPLVGLWEMEEEGSILEHTIVTRVSSDVALVHVDIVYSTL